MRLSEHKALPLLVALDKPLVDALRSSAVKLIDADRIRDGTITKIMRRQDLERLERERGVRLFLSPERSIEVHGSYEREIASLTYGWDTPDGDDPTGEYLAAVRRYLLSALGEHVKGVFWDCPCLPETVVKLFDDYITNIGNAKAYSGEGHPGEYVGERNAAGQREGRGKKVLADGDVYEGECKADEMEGRRYASGAVYEGEYKAGMREGRGIVRSASGNVYEGEYKAGMREGRGIFRYASGAVYEGEFKADKMEGRGIFRSADGNVYDGEFKAGMREGRGIYRFASGNVYEGEWKADKSEGRGKYV